MCAYVWSDQLQIFRREFMNHYKLHIHKFLKFFNLLVAIGDCYDLITLIKDRLVYHRYILCIINPLSLSKERINLYEGKYTLLR